MPMALMFAILNIQPHMYPMVGAAFKAAVATQRCLGFDILRVGNGEEIKQRHTRVTAKGSNTIGAVSKLEKLWDRL